MTSATMTRRPTKADHPAAANMAPPPSRPFPPRDPHGRPQPPPRRHPLRPTILDAVLLAMYPATLVAGSVYAALDPQIRAAPYDATARALARGAAPWYFAQKTNVFNTLFVKRGWFWISASFLSFLFTYPALGPSGFSLTARRVRGFARWGLATLWWVFVTQWFFGAPIIDRSFILTGGQCELLTEAKRGTVRIDATRRSLTALACKTIGGQWKGGHDISGHVFLLVLGSMFLFQEALYAMRLAANQPEERTILVSDRTVKRADEGIPVAPGLALENNPYSRFGISFLFGVAGLSMWMLLMTAIYFHTWFEKFTGLVVALAGVFIVYFLPRVLPPFRGLIGLPGV